MTIDRVHKWLLSNYSFVFMLIDLTSFVCTKRIENNLCFKVRLARMISTGRQKNDFMAAIFEYGLQIGRNLRLHLRYTTLSHHVNIILNMYIILNRSENK